MKKVVIGRKWHNPEIELLVTDQEIALSVTLNDYLLALVDEMGTPKLSQYWTKEQLKTQLLAASQRVDSGIKFESTQGVK